MLGGIDADIMELLHAPYRRQLVAEKQRLVLDLFFDNLGYFQVECFLALHGLLVFWAIVGCACVLGIWA
ncbi:hypothetical protein D9M72_588410 [compost metagenome]